MNGAMSIRNKKWKKHQCREGYARSLEGKRVEWGGENNIDYVWEV